MKSINQIKMICLLGACLLITTRLKAQLTPLSGIYFQNQYLGNPAMAGIENGLSLNCGFRQLWSVIPGSPKTQSFTAEYKTGKKVGLGLNINNDEAGLIKRSRVMGTYSYHQSLNKETRKLRLGLSFGFMDERIMSEQIDGDQNDLSVSRFNQRETYLDADFGVAYTSERLTIQGAVPNLKNFLRKDAAGAADQAVFYSAISYKLNYPGFLDGFEFEPKIALRGVKGFDNILDLGANFSVANRAANVMVIYHSTESATIGLGAVIKSLGYINANYTTSTGGLKEYTNGNFELSLRLNFFTGK